MGVHQGDSKEYPKHNKCRSACPIFHTHDFALYFEDYLMDECHTSG